MHIVNDKENEGQYIEFLSHPRRYRSDRWQTTLSIGWSPRRWGFGFEVDFADSRTRCVLFSFGPIYLAALSER